MTHLPIVGDDDVATREEQIAFLRGHKRYHTMNSWNNATSYAHGIKIGHLQGLSREDRDKCYQGLECEQAFFNFNDELFIFGIENKGWSIGTNGRSGGYLVLYRREGDKIFPGRGLDADEDFHDWDDESIAARVDEVRRFDEACESAVAAYVDFCRQHKFVEKTRMIPQTYVGAEEEI